MGKTYYSPGGNPEVWVEGTQPEGYLTEEEWNALHPYVPPVPTKEEQLSALTAGYQQEKTNLVEAYTTATMQGDTETAQSVAQDMTDLDAWFDEEYERINEEVEDNG
jgi:hypothetical protein